MIVELTAATFDEKVVNDKKPSVVKIYTPSCPNCKTIAPIFEETAKNNTANFNFFSLNAHEHIDIAKRYKVLGVPTLLFFSNGILVNKKTGAISQKRIEKRLKPIIEYTLQEAKEKEVTGFFKLPWK